MSYYLKGIAICLSKEELINELNKLKTKNMKNNIKLIIIIIAVVEITQAPIRVIIGTGIAKGNMLISCCLTYIIAITGLFAFWIVKKIINKFNW